MVSWLMFKSLSHFEFIFVHDEKVCSILLLYIHQFNFSSTTKLKRLFFPHFIFLPSLSKIN